MDRSTRDTHVKKHLNSDSNTVETLWLGQSKQSEDLFIFSMIINKSVVLHRHINKARISNQYKNLPYNRNSETWPSYLVSGIIFTACVYSYP